MSERRYVQIWLMLTIVPLGLVLALNIVVDPYRLRLAGSIGDAGILRPDVYSFVRVNKAFGIAREDADVVLLGSSRVQWGFERDAPPFTGRRPFNLALSGPRFDEVWATFQCMLAHGTPRTAIVGLDFTAFNMRGAPETQLFRCTDSWDRALSAYVSGTAFNATLAAIRSTLADNDPGSRASRQVLDANGFSRSSLRFEPYLKTDGHHTLFRTVEDSYMGAYASFSLTDARGKSLFADFRAMLKRARASGIELKVFIQPEHARQLELVRAAGLWPTYEEWKRTLATIVDEESGGNGNTLELWDFGNYDSVTTEALPAKGDVQSRMKYFTDVSHYTPVVGQMILMRLLGDEQTQGSVPQTFGHRLTTHNLEERLAEVRRAQADYRAAHASEVFEIERRMTLRLKQMPPLATDR